MWQTILATLIVIAAAVYAARTLGPRRWRRKARGAGADGSGGGPCGCGKDDGGCR
jgi:uncharacterized membrane protein YccC